MADSVGGLALATWTWRRGPSTSLWTLSRLGELEAPSPVEGLVERAYRAVGGWTRLRCGIACLQAVRGAEGEISASSSRVRVFVIPANEELVVARETLRCIATHP